MNIKKLANGFLVAGFLLVGISSAVGKSERQLSADKLSDADMKWWNDARFGMFIHWGVYSAFAGDWNGQDWGKEMSGPSAEWIYLTADIPKAAYEKKAAGFNPVNYDPAEWVSLAKAAGMKYMVLTSKHHDGFALFDTQASDWSIMKASSYQKDIVKAYIDECHKQGMGVGLYYSHEKDWYHRIKARMAKGPMPDEYAEIVETHLKELLTNYGKIDVIWFDMGIDEHKEFNKMCRDMVRKYQPECIVSSRIGNGLGDYRNLGDRELVLPGGTGNTESIMTMRLNWGYDRNDSSWKSSDEVISMLSKCACRNSNFLLNIGPQPDGRMTPEEVIRLKEIGTWMDRHSDAIYATQGSPFKGEYEWGSITSKDNQLFLHLFNWDGGEITVNAISSKITKASFMHDGSAVKFKQDDAGITLSLGEKPTGDCRLAIVELELDSELTVDLSEGPTFVPPVIKHKNRKMQVGTLFANDEKTFTITSKKAKVAYSLNDHIEYRINDHGSVSVVEPFDLEKGETYKVVYTPHAKTSFGVDIIVLMKK